MTSEREDYTDLDNSVDPMNSDNTYEVMLSNNTNLSQLVHATSYDENMQEQIHKENEETTQNNKNKLINFANSKSSEVVSWMFKEFYAIDKKRLQRVMAKKEQANGGKKEAKAKKPAKTKKESIEPINSEYSTLVMKMTSNFDQSMGLVKMVKELPMETKNRIIKIFEEFKSTLNSKVKPKIQFNTALRDFFKGIKSYITGFTSFDNIFPIQVSVN